MSLLASLLGCFCDSPEDNAIELPPAINNSLICKIGKVSKNLELINDPLKGTHILSSQGSKGMAISNFALECDCGKWEVVVKRPGRILVGVAQIKPDTEADSLLSLSLADLSNTGRVQVNYLSLEGYNEGDVVTVLWDLTDYPMVKFLHNNRDCEEVYKLKACRFIYPVFSIDGDGEIEIIFDERKFHHKHAKYGMILNSTNLI